MKVSVSAKSLVVVAALAVLALGIGLISQGTATAQTPTPTPAPLGPNVPTTAEVTGCTPAEKPVINWKWELPDVDSNTSGMQYGQDDDCIQEPVSPPDDHHMMQMYPNLEDDPEARQIEYCAAVEDPNGIDNVDLVKARVYEPVDDDGDTLVDEDPVDVPPDDDDGDTELDEDGPNLKYDVILCDETHPPVACAALGDPDDPSTLLGAAVETGQMDVEEAEDLIYLCGQNAKKICCGTQTISKHQPAGEYRVLIQATDQCGGMGTMENWFDVLPIVGLEIDFDLVDWGSISPGSKDWVQGDQPPPATNWNPPSDTKPTVKNTGNTLMYLYLHYSQMLGEDTGEIINSFDATFLGQTIDPMTASSNYCFSNGLGSNVMAKLDFSINPPKPLSQDTYNGSVDIWGTLSCP